VLAAHRAVCESNKLSVQRGTRTPVRYSRPDARTWISTTSLADDESRSFDALPPVLFGTEDLKANKRRIILLRMALRSCLVSCRDLAGTEHAVEVSSESQYEAVAQALRILRGDQWAEEIGEGLTKLKVRVKLNSRQ
jgi:hypothetical protein